MERLLRTKELPPDGRGVSMEANGLRVLLVGDGSMGALRLSYERAFVQLGAEVWTYDHAAVGQEVWPGLRHRAGRRLAYRSIVRQLNTTARSDLAGHGAPLVLVFKGRELTRRTVQSLAVSGSWVANFYPDDPFDGPWINRPVDGIGALAAYHHRFVFARRLVDEFQRRGCGTSSWLPFARDPKLHAPIRELREPSFDVVFVGNLDRERIRWMEHIPPGRLAVFGHARKADVPRRSPLRRAAFFPAAFEKDLGVALSQGAISLNVMRRQNRFTHNMRSFEALACGVFTFSQRNDEVLELFEEGRHLACWGSPSELVDGIDYWMERPQERAEIARAGFERVRHDTYVQRARSILAHWARTTTSNL